MFVHDVVNACPCYRICVHIDNVFVDISILHFVTFYQCSGILIYGNVDQNIDIQIDIFLIYSMKNFGIYCTVTSVVKEAI